MNAKPFEFMAVGSLSDGNLKLLLAECRSAEANSWRVPSYLFQMQSETGQYMGRIRPRVG